MKIKDIISFCALAILIMAGCSKVEHNPSPSPRPSEGDEWLYDVNLPVPILFGSGKVLSKAPVTSVDDLADKTLGVFAVDKDADRWAAADGTVYLNDESAHYDPATGSIGFGASPAEPTTNYYPAESDINLDFYAYHPKVTDATEVRSDIITVSVPLGTSDILWAKAEAQDMSVDGKLYRGFNAEYIRKFPEVENRPRLEFSHPASAIRFRIVKTESSGSRVIRSSALTLKNMAQTADLCVAAKGSAQVQPGTLIDDRSQRKDLTVNTATTLTNEKQILCYVFLLPESSRKVVEGEIVLNNNTSVPFTIDLDELGAVVEGFQPGYAYNILLTVDERLNVSVSADVKKVPEVEVGGDVGSEDFEDGFNIEV